MFNIPNYNMIRKDRRSGRGGGVAMYVHDQFRYKLRPNLRIDGVESLFIEIINEKHKNIIIGVIYRPPNSTIESFLDSLDIFLNTILHENKSLFLMGDYNIDLLQTAHHNSSRFLNLLSSGTLYPHIDKPTRICDTTSRESLIDNIFSNILNKKCSNGILFSDISDHLPIFAIYEQFGNVYSKQVPFKMQRKESQENINSLIYDLSHEQWQDVFSSGDANLSYDLFLQKFLYYFDKNIPLIRNTNRNKIKQPWITQGLMRCIFTRNRLYKISLRKPTSQNKDKYKKYRNTLTTLIRASRKRYYSDKVVLNKDNKSSLWRTVNDLIKSKKKEIPNVMTDNDQDINDPTKIANCFNNFFTNIGPTLASTININVGNFTDYLPKRNMNSLFFTPTNENEILNIVRSFKSSRSCGHDGLSMHLLKQIIHSLVTPLTHICNLSLSTGIFPNSLKIAKVIPIYKKR